VGQLAEPDLDSAASLLDCMPEVIRSSLALRRKRDEIFGADLFHDPAWELLLLLFGAGRTGLSIDFLAAEVSGAKTAIRRWLAVLVDQGFVQEHTADSDSYALTTLGSEKLAQLGAIY